MHSQADIGIMLVPTTQIGSETINNELATVETMYTCICRGQTDEMPLGDQQVEGYSAHEVTVI